MAPRGAAWRPPELRHLVHLVGVHMPSTEEDWEGVKELHNLAFPHNRTLTALSNKFKDLYRMKMPTGDPKIPDYVQRAKEIYRDFIERTDGSDGAADDVDDYDEDSNINGDLVDEEVEDEDDELTHFFDAANSEQLPNILPPPDGGDAPCLALHPGAAIVPPPPQLLLQHPVVIQGAQDLPSRVLNPSLFSK